MVDVSKIKVGDEVTVRAKVDSVQHADSASLISVFVRGINHTHCILSSEIASHTPKPRAFKPGDRALDREFSGTVIWFIVHTKDGWAWVEDANGWQRLAAISDLRHADESE